MKKSRKKLLASIAACILAGTMAFNGTMAYLTDTEGAVNIATVGDVKIDLEEPGYPGNDSEEVAAILPNQEIVKDPLVENTGDNAALVYLKVDVPQETFTELGTDGVNGETKLQDLFALKGLSENWELIRTETSTNADTAKTKTTYVYAYKQPLEKSAKTDKLFERVQMKNAMENDLSGKVEDIVIQACAIQATDIPDVNLTAGEDGNLTSATLSTVYDIFLKQSGDISPRPADEGNKTQEGKLGKILYELDGGEISGALSSYDTENYGYVPPTPVKKNFKFLGWAPEQLPDDSTGAVTFTAQWEESSAELLSGQEINVKMKKLAGNSTATDRNVDRSITAIQRSDEVPSDTVMEDPNSLISTDASGKPVYAWFDDGVLSWWSNAEYINAGSKLSYLCRNMANLADVSGLADWNTGSVTDMSNMFDGCNQLTDLTGLTNWQTGNVANMKRMFEECSQLTDLTGLKNWQTDSVTDMFYMFHKCGQLTDLTPLENWQTDKVTNMGRMFEECSQLTDLTGLVNWKTGNATNMDWMFQECRQLTDLTPLRSWQTGNVTNMESMFYGCNQLTDLTGLTN